MCQTPVDAGCNAVLPELALAGRLAWLFLSDTRHETNHVYNDRKLARRVTAPLANKC